jgi:hypothetical protein
LPRRSSFRSEPESPTALLGKAPLGVPRGTPRRSQPAEIFIPEHLNDPRDPWRHGDREGSTPFSTRTQSTPLFTPRYLPPTIWPPLKHAVCSSWAIADPLTLVVGLVGADLIRACLTFARTLRSTPPTLTPTPRICLLPISRPHRLHVQGTEATEYIHCHACVQLLG